MIKKTALRHLSIQDRIKEIGMRIDASTDYVVKNRLEQELFALKRELEDIENE